MQFKGADKLHFLARARSRETTPLKARPFSSIYGEELLSLLGAPIPVKEKGAQQKGGDEVDYSDVDTLPAPLVALCLSGGGIRSASFGLGVLQGLARFGLLGQFHYLSTVSGGGYIGSFLTAWRAHEKNDAAVFRKLNRPAHKDGREADEVRSIRAFSNYLTPRVGLFSADTWTAIAIVVRNLLLNWTIFLPFFMGALLIPRLCRDTLRAFAGPAMAHPQYLTFGAAISCVVGFTFASYGRRRSEAKWLTNGRFLQLVVVPLVVSSVFLTARTGVLLTSNFGKPVFADAFPGWLGAEYGAASYVIAWVLASLALLRRRNQKFTLQSRIVDPALDVLAWGISGALVGYLIILGMSLAPVWLARYTTKAEPVAPFLVVAGISWTMLSVLCGELLFVGLRSYAPRGDTDREWLARSAGWLAVVAASWSLFSAIGLYGPDALKSGGSAFLRWSTLGTAGISGAVSLFLGNSARTAAQAAQLLGKRFSVSQIASLAAIVFAVTLTILVSWIDDLVLGKIADRLGQDHDRWGLDAIGVVALALMSALVSVFINVNRFSLHALYRNRLVRAFLGSARAGQNAAGTGANDRAQHVDPFTEFAQTDNVRMKDMPTNRLLHVINITLNVVSTGNLAWQQRKAEPFTVTPLSCGNPNVGYRPTKFYANSREGITLGTAMAISGAAVSPNMGAHSSPLLGFLLTLFNLRLGWWLGNPQFPAASGRPGPWIGLLPLLQELAGQTTDRRRWVYLSDGGHFDNLGLYEMVRRRCRVIVVSDAGCDPTFSLSDLGDCLRKIYIDQGVSIDFRDFDIKARQTPPVSGPYSAIADISYPGSPTKGWLLYIKPGYHGSERADVRSYAEAHGAFPHEPTGEQWFNESQLESYRALGAHITEMLCNRGKPLLPADMPAELDIEAFKTSAEAASRSGGQARVLAVRPRRFNGRARARKFGGAVPAPPNPPSFS